VATEKEKAADILGFKTTTVIAGLVGLIGGFLFGVWDSVTVIFEHAPSSLALGEIFFLALYSVAIYAVIGCLGMAIIGAATGGVISAGEYRVKKSQLAGIFIGVFTLLAISALLARSIIYGNTIEITENTIISVLSGAGLAALSIYVVDRGIKKDKLIALGISLFVSLLVLLYGGLWLNLSLLSGGVFKPANLLANVVFLIIACLLAVGLYILTLSLLRRYSPQRIKQAGYILLTVIICAFIAISSIGPFDSKRNPKTGASATGEIGITANSDNLRGKPNILWIVMDAARADHLSCYGYHRNTTPNIDRIASEGILFENAISAAPWTLPSHASMFTGMFSSKHGTDAEHKWLEDDFQTIAEVLRSHGYMTFEYSNNPMLGRGNNMSQGFDTAEITSWGRVGARSGLADLLKINIFMREVQNYLRMDDGARRTNEIVKEWITEPIKQRHPSFFS